jgi:hypothetical protein
MVVNITHILYAPNFHINQICLVFCVYSSRPSSLLTSVTVSVFFFIVSIHHDVYSSPSIIRIIKSRRMRWAGHVARMGEKRTAYRLLVGKPEGRRPLGRPRRRWVVNIRMDLGEV